MRTFFVENFGCRATQADGAALESLLQHQGMQPASGRNQAELVILNTCTVTSGADSDVRAAIRRVHRENPQTNILVTGCYAQRAPDELAAMPGVCWVVGNSHKSQIPEIVTGAPYHGAIHVGDIYAAHDMLTAPVFDSLAGRARPNFKIQDGCDNRCSFCVIPAVRGGSRFLPADRVVAQIRELSTRYREIVLTGINLGRWGRESGSDLRLVGLLRRVLAETPVDRIRLSSVEPMDWSDELIEFIAASSGRIAPHVHMPLQSGSDRILRLMRRKYRPRHYADRVWKAYARIPDVAVGADVMTGFPGETDELFEESRRFIEDLPLTSLHVFTFSERPGTAAANMPGSVEIPIRRERTRVLRELGERKHRAFRERLLGRKLSAVTLEEPGLALTGNFVTVETGKWTGPNCLVDVRLDVLTERGARERPLLPVLATR